MKFYKSIVRNNKGQSLVEFALVMPILLSLILGMLEFGWYFNGLITVNSAAREGARTAIVYENDTDAKIPVKDAVKSSLDVSSFAFNHADVALPMDTGENSNRVKVDAYADFDPLVGIFLEKKMISASAIMRLE